MQQSPANLRSWARSISRASTDRLRRLATLVVFVREMEAIITNSRWSYSTKCWVHCPVSPIEATRIRSSTGPRCSKHRREKPCSRRRRLARTLPHPRAIGSGSMLTPAHHEASSAYRCSHGEGAGRPGPINSSLTLISTRAAGGSEFGGPHSASCRTGRCLSMRRAPSWLAFAAFATRSVRRDHHFPQSTSSFTPVRLARAPVQLVPQLQERHQALQAARSRAVLAQDMRRHRL